MHTIAESKQYLKDNFEKGCICPSCRQHVKLYKRKLNASMSYGLIIIHRLHLTHGFKKYFNMNFEIAKMKIPSSNVEYAKLAYWGLIEQKDNVDESKKNSGAWKITQKGIDYANRKISLPSHVLIYNNKVQGFSEEQTTIEKSLTKKFNYKELMQN